MLKIYNTLTRQQEVFTPLHQGRVGMYVCGPTVYGHSHVGHAKSYVSFDTIVRYLRYIGYTVRYVQNITDVGHLTDDATGMADEGEDKIERRAREEHLEPMEIVEMYAASYFEDMDALNVVRPNISPRATGHIPEQVEMVERLLNRGYAYEVNGSVYFDVRRFPGYGKLSGRRLEELEAGSRIEVNPEKQYLGDFALWKCADVHHLMRWRSPWGIGFPGWHLECSSMSMKYLGETFDIHGGGLENVFPHHECEIAQSEAITGKPFVRYWMHNNMVTVDGQKMGKSLGNFITLKQAFQRFSPLTVRLFILSSHYRSPLDFSDAALAAADQGRERLEQTLLRIREREIMARQGDVDQTILERFEPYIRQFMDAMDDDFNTAEAVGVLFEMTREINRLVSASDVALYRETFRAIHDQYMELGGTILGLLRDEAVTQKRRGLSGLEESFVALLIDVRSFLRKEKRWELSDMIRDRLRELEITIEDSHEKTRWRENFS
ncbi:MAG: cysteine--tRNA ligase [Candidatus Latescibacteria bacterium]|nr:cysteine--tRNA ligase [Candidatus Latescibacterota bacterium]